jgi:hypothetical protein
VVLAAAVAVLHGVLVAFLLTGAWVALRWPRVLWLHVPVLLVILGLYLTGADCPLTTLELNLRESSGQPGYTGGFIGHYVTEPLGFPIKATSTQIGIYATAFLSNALGYGLQARRRVRGRTARPSEGSAASSGGRQQVAAELLEQPDEVVVAPPLDDPAVGEPVHVDAGPADRRAGGRDTR